MLSVIYVGTCVEEYSGDALSLRAYRRVRAEDASFRCLQVETAVIHKKAGLRTLQDIDLLRWDDMFMQDGCIGPSKRERI